RRAAGDVRPTRPPLWARGARELTECMDLAPPLRIEPGGNRLLDRGQSRLHLGKRKLQQRIVHGGESSRRRKQKIACLRRIAQDASLNEAERFLLANFVETYLELKGEEAMAYATLLSKEVWNGEV